jgi:MFS transporter, putative metabolite:H+ symporter
MVWRPISASQADVVTPSERTDAATTNAHRTAEVNARIDRLPACRATWLPTVVVSFAGIFEIYDLLQTAYLTPGLVKSGIFNGIQPDHLGISDQALFAAATFTGLFVGASGFASIADKFGRRAVFIYALLAYSAATLCLACQTTVIGIDCARFVAGIGLGIELVTIDAYLVEVTPAHMRGRAFGVNHFIQYLSVPLLAFLSWLLIPKSPLGIDGWRWVVLIGSLGALVVWFLRRALPESPRWLARNGRHEEASRIVSNMERRVIACTGRPLPAPAAGQLELDHKAGFLEIWRSPYTRRTIMLTIFNFFQTIGFFGFTNWLPTLLAAQGAGFTKSLFYSFCIAFAYPITPLLWAATVAERFERKWLIVLAALGVAVAGPLFALVSQPVLLVILGVIITGFVTLLSMSYHPYQAELYPTRVRARAVGFVYSFSRISTALTSFLIAFALRNYGTPGVFTLISISMLIVMISIGVFGPRTRGRALEDISL